MYKLSFTEKAVLFLVIAILITGYALFYSDVPLFESFVREDGVVEWLTVFGLLSACFVCLRRLWQLRKHKKPWFLFVTGLLAVLLFFAAGEEISWGQRLFHIKSSEFFLEKNTQGETNLHNLVVNGVKLNKIIFSIGLIAVMAIYLVVIPFLSRKNSKFNALIESSAVPVPRDYHVISILIVFGITSFLPHEKKAELLEAGMALLFYLIIKFPANRIIFKRPPKKALTAN